VDLLEPVTGEFGGIGVHAPRRPPEGLLQTLPALDHPGTPALKDPQPGAGVSAAEERETPVERVVVPGGPFGGGQDGVQILVAGVGELINDPGATATSARRGRRRGDESA